MNTVKLELEPGKPLQVYGEADVHVLHGEICIFGKLFGRDSRIRVPSFRGYPVEALCKSIIEVEYHGKKPEFIEGIGTSIWKDKAQDFIVNPSDVIVIGGVDSGKTGLTKYLTNISVYNGWAVGVIDLDPGQGDIGIPGFIGGGVANKPLINLEDIDSQVYRFVGTITPMGDEDKIERNLLVIKRLIPKSDYTILNLHGWIVGFRAIRHIYNIIKSSGVSSIIYLSDRRTDPYVKYLFDYLKLSGLNIKTYVFKKARATPRTRQQRKQIREIKYLNYIKGTDFVKKSISIDYLIGEDRRLLLSNAIEPELLKKLISIYNLEKFPDAIVLKDMVVKLIYQSDNINKPLLWLHKSRFNLPVYISMFPIDGYAILSALSIEDIHVPVFVTGLDFSRYMAYTLIPTSYAQRSYDKLMLGRIIVDVNEGKEIGVLKSDLL